MFQKIARGEMPNAIDVARTVLYSEKAVLGIGKMLGANASGLATISKLHPYVFAAMEGAMFAAAKVEHVKEMDYERKSFQIELNRGERSQKDADLWRSATLNPDGTQNIAKTVLAGLKFLGGTNPWKEKIDENDKRAAELGELKGATVDRAVKEIRDRKVQESLVIKGVTGIDLTEARLSYAGIKDLKTGKIISGNEYQRRIESEIEKKRQASQGFFNEEQKKEAIRDAMQQFYINDELLKEIKKAADLEAKEKKELASPTRQLKLARQEKMYGFSESIINKRVPANPTE
jgi:hypothetical protein